MKSGNVAKDENPHIKNATIPTMDPFGSFDWFFKDVFGLDRVAKDGTGNVPKKGVDEL